MLSDDLRTDPTRILLHAANSDACARLRALAELLERRPGPGLPRLVTADLRDDGGVLTLARPAGKPLSEVLSRRALSSLELVRLATDLMDALRTVQGSGALQLSIRAERVIQCDRGGFVLVGWTGFTPAGAAAVLEPLEDHRYLSPQRQKGVHETSSDLYAAGVLILEAALGRPEFERRLPAIYAERPREDEPAASADRRRWQRHAATADPLFDASIPQTGAGALLAPWIEALIHRDPGRRPNDAAESLRRLDQLLDGHLPPPPARRLSRTRLAFALAAASVLTLAAVAVPAPTQTATRCGVADQALREKELVVRRSILDSKAVHELAVTYQQGGCTEWSLALLQAHESALDRDRTLPEKHRAARLRWVRAQLNLEGETP